MAIAYEIGKRRHRNRPDATWVCRICGKIINGKRNTIHLGILSHMRKHNAEDLEHEKIFPVLGGHKDLKGIPWKLVQSHEGQTKRNHSQSLQRLAERGGLDPLELYAVLHDWDWSIMKDLNISIEEAISFIKQLIEEY